MYMMVPNRTRNDLFNMDPFTFFDRCLTGNAARVPDADITEKGDSYEIAMDLPGFRREEISLETEDGILTIAAAHQAEKTEENADAAQPAVRWISRERYTGSFRRAFRLDGIDENAIGARFENGTLTVRLPKAAQDVPAAHRIEIEG